MRRILAQAALRLIAPGLETRLRAAEEDVRRYAVHLYVASARSDMVMQLLTEGERAAFERGWAKCEAEVIEKARAWQRSPEPRQGIAT